jgi:hypothetical protein
MEFCDGGSLLDLMQACKFTFTEDQVRFHGILNDFSWNFSACAYVLSADFRDNRADGGGTGVSTQAQDIAP